MLDIDLTEFSYEQLAHALYVKGKQDGYHKITDKTKWREAVVAEKLGHRAFTKISAGKNSDKHGADAHDPSANKMAEYKSSAIEDKQIRNLLGKTKNAKKKTLYSPLTIGGVYNGAYTHEIIDTYVDKDHYFAIFHEETCTMIMKVQTAEVIRQLRAEVDRRAKLKKKGSTNLNTVRINLADIDLYQVVYRDAVWHEAHKD